MVLSTSGSKRSVETRRNFLPTSPSRIFVLHCIHQIPISYDPLPLPQSFGRILPFRDDVRRLASSILYGLSARYSLNHDFDGGIGRQAFFECHLRTAVNAQKAGWPAYDVQSRAYLDRAVAHGLSIIYVASGDKDAVARFQEDAAKEGRVVVTKQDLLDPEQIEQLSHLTWDQQGLIDFEVLLKSSRFAGIQDSSFALHVAFRRRVLSKTAVTQAVLEDEFSIIYNFANSGNWMTFAYAMWP